jgi:hypothetical protein
MVLSVDPASAEAAVALAHASGVGAVVVGEIRAGHARVVLQ